MSRGSEIADVWLCERFLPIGRAISFFLKVRFYRG